jgi:hypothetical protein
MEGEGRGGDGRGREGNGKGKKEKGGEIAPKHKSLTPPMPLLSLLVFNNVACAID